MAKRVLIAEDDPTSLLVLQRVLDKWGHEVVVCHDGTEAWERMQEPDAPRLAILDWMMPGLDGREICQRVRQRAESNPPYLILLTALGRKEDVVYGLESGADDYITKPFDANELRARLDVGLRVMELQTALFRKVEELENALSHVKTLQGILPICMHCHKIRTDHDAWQKLEQYISEHADVQFTHGLCPECMDKFYPRNRPFVFKPVPETSTREGAGTPDQDPDTQPSPEDAGASR